MDHIQSGYRGLSLLVDLNIDRILSTGAILLALSGAVFTMSLFF